MGELEGDWVTGFTFIPTVFATSITSCKLGPEISFP